MRKKLSPLLLISALFLDSFALNVHAAENYSLLGGILEDFRYLATSPARVNKKGALATLGVVGLGGFIYLQDEKIRDYVRNHKTPSLDSLSPTAEKLGNGIYDVGFLLVYGGSGYLLNNEKMQETAILSFESFIFANAVGTAIKSGGGRARPYTGEGRESYKLFSSDEDHTSFPSGHTTSAFSIASVFADEYNEKPWVGVTAYTLASAVALQRLYDDKHWSSDVFVGAVLGTVVGKSLVYLHKRERVDNVLLIPMFVPSEAKYVITAVGRF